MWYTKINQSQSQWTAGSLLSHARMFSSDEARRDEDKQTKNFHPVYVHHISKLTLEYLQNQKYDWLLEKGLDRGLRINQNGTFVLSFPAQKGLDTGKIWTSYDSSRKQHWLSIYRQKLAVRFLLKDHGGQYLKTTEAINSADPNRMIRMAVDQLIATVDQVEDFSSETPQSQSASTKN